MYNSGHASGCQELICILRTSPTECLRLGKCLNGYSDSWNYVYGNQSLKACELVFVTVYVLCCFKLVNKYKCLKNPLYFISEVFIGHTYNYIGKGGGFLGQKSIKCWECIPSFFRIRDSV